MTAPSHWLTVLQVASTLHAHPEVVRRWLRQGRLRGVKVGRAWRVPGTALPHPDGLPVNVLEGTVRRVDARAGIAWVESSGGTMAVNAAALRRGMPVRIHLGGDGILVARRPLRGVSARNQWPGVVSSLLHREDGVEVRVATRPPLVAWMTPGAARELDLRPGARVVLVFKAGACRVHVADEPPSARRRPVRQGTKRRPRR